MEKAVNIYPENLIQVLEFDKIIDKAQSFCYGEPAQHRIQDFGFSTDRAVIEKELLCIKEVNDACDEDLHLPLAPYDAFEQELKFLAIRNYVLELDAVNGLRYLIRLSIDLIKYLDNKKDYFPLLYQRIAGLKDLSPVLHELNKVLDEDGNVKRDATPELSRIRRMIGSKTVELQREFSRIANEYKNQSLLAENVESYRNGRRVLAVPVENKRKIPGIIHDESTTGRTAFIEPQAVISINNDLFDLEIEERKEIYRILKELCTIMSKYIQELKDWVEAVTDIDSWNARYKLARLMNCSMPEISEETCISLVGVKHPVLLLKNIENQDAVIPFDLRLLGNNRILLLSGPNAGGKSIVMKTVGLIQLMFQHGFLIPADPMTKMSIFGSVFGDIGDSQSIENDLSTYSSHLKNMKYFTDRADKKTLILLDEFGAGTDPKLGGAIAESVLEYLLKRGAYGVVTTHYGNLKAYAFKHKGIVNGAMFFDKETLSPTYELNVGRPGSSYAFEVAHQSGLNERIIEKAKSRSGDAHTSLEELLMQLEADKIALEKSKEILRQKQIEVDRLIKNYKNMHDEFEFRRKKLKLEQKEAEMREINQIQHKAENLLKELQKEKNVEKAKAIVEEKRKDQEKIASQMSELQESVHRHLIEEFGKKELVAGDPVRIKEGGAVGEIIEIKGKKATVQMGLMKVVTPVNTLIPVSPSIIIQRKKSVNIDIVQSASENKTDLDVRGYRREDALDSVQDFLDKAMLNRVSSVKIIHGKGNGILKRAVWEKIREYSSVRDVYHPEPEAGGEGITIVEM